MGTELATIDRTNTTLSAVDIRAQVNLIQEVMRAVMKNGTHYGTIPGCPKPSLFKAGAEKIAVTFRLAITSTAEDLSTSDEAKYRVTATAQTREGVDLGSAIGVCSSLEEKYKWRKPVCDEEFNETPENQRREVWKKGKDKAYKVKQVRTEQADIANTILQMADKRAYVAVVRRVTAASDVFTQDIEDLPPEVAETINQDTRPPVAMPQERAPERSIDPNPAPAYAVTGAIEDVQVKDGTKKDGGKWTRYGVKVQGAMYGTFDATLGNKALAMRETGENVIVTFTTDAKGYHTIDTLEFAAK